MTLLLSILVSIAAFQEQTPPVRPKLTPVPKPAEVNIAGELNPIGISAEEAARIAVEQNPRIRIAQAAVSLAHGKLVEVRAPSLPSASLTSSANAVSPLGPNGSSSSSTGSSSSGGSQGFSSGVSLKALVFDFGHTVALVRQSAATERAASHAFSRAQQDIAYQAKQAYYQLLQNEGLVRVQESNLADRQAQLDLANARFNAGPGAPSDVLRAQTAVGDATQSLVQARNNATLSRIALAVAMGINPRTPVTTMDTDEPPVAGTLDVLIGQALKVRPDLLQVLQQIRAAGYELVAAKSTSAPAISVSAAYAPRGVTQPFDNQNGSLGVSLSWSIWDGGVTAGRTQQAQADLTTARSNLELLQLTILSDVAGNWSSTQYAEQRVATASSEEKNAQENLRIAQGRFQAGLGTFLEVTDAEASLVSAKEAVVSARAALMIARAGLRHAVGG